MMMKCNTSFNLGIDNKALSRGFVLPLKVNCKKTPHILLCGSTGSGKTYALKYILKQLAISNSLIYSCDYISFEVLNFTIQISNEKLAVALYKLSNKERDVIQSGRASCRERV